LYESTKKVNGFQFGTEGVTYKGTVARRIATQKDLKKKVYFSRTSEHGSSSCSTSGCVALHKYT
jgi:hypothetical protein